MKKGFYWFLFALLTAVLQVSCTSVLVVENSKPAEVNIRPDQWKVVAVNNYSPDSLLSEDELKIYSSGAKEAFFGAVDAIIEDSTYSLIHSDSAFFLNSGGGLLSQSQLREIYRQNEYHLLLSLDDFSVKMKKETESVTREDGSESFIIYYTLVANSSWTLYDSLGNKLDGAELSEEGLYKSRPLVLGLVTGAPAMKNAGDEIKDIAWFTGYDYWKRLWPQPVKYARPYYSSNKLRGAAAKMAEKEWQEAIALLEPLSYGNSKTAARACFNLAVIYEAMGNIEAAKFWASEAVLKNNSLAIKLLNELENK